MEMLLNFIKLNRLFLLCCLLHHACISLVNGQCTQDGSCKCTSSQGTLDLSPITGSPAFQDQSDTGGAWLYSYSPCTPFTEGSGECTNVAVCQVNSDQSESYPCGTVDSATFGQDTTSGNTVVTYSSTDSTGTTRTTIVLLQCDSSGGADTLTVQGEDPNTPATYLMTLKSPHCCFNSGPGPGPGPGNNGGDEGGLSIGSILCIVAVALLAVYVIAGIGFQKGVRKAQGKEMLPNYTIWASFPGLVKDGVLFTVRGCKSSPSYDKV